MTISLRTRPLAVLLALIVAASPAAASAAGTSVRVTATGMKSSDGEVICALHRAALAFPNKPELAKPRVVASIRGGTATCVFDRAAGPAAISIYLGANANGKLELRFGVIPRESIGASNNPKASLGPPKHDAARFVVGELPVVRTVTLQQP